MSQDYDFMDAEIGQMYHDFYNNYEDGEAFVQCPHCGREFYVDGDERYAECPYCGEKMELEEQ